MTKTSMFAFLIALAAAPGFAQEPAAPVADHAAPPKMERNTSEATWPEGKLTINYGAPEWKEDFAKEMDGMAKEGAVWRLGNNLPTTAALTCGLESADGAIPPGTYNLSLRAGAANTWDLLVYEAFPLYDKAFKTWAIKSSGPATTSKEIAKHLKLEVSKDQKTLSVRFGPMAVNYDLKPIKCNPVVKTEFADAETSFTVLAVPLAGKTMKDTLVGVATTVRNGITARYHLKLTVDGDKATLNFVNERAAGLAKEKEWFENVTKRIGEMIEKNPERKEMAEPILAAFKQSHESVEMMMKGYERLQPTQVLTGTMSKRDAPGTELGLMYDETKDRKAGAIVLNLGLENHIASFEVKPRGQFIKRRQE